MDAKQPIDLKELSLKASSKKELYFVLLNDCKVYTFHIQDVNVSYIRSVLTGAVKVS